MLRVGATGTNKQQQHGGIRVHRTTRHCGSPVYTGQHVITGCLSTQDNASLQAIQNGWMYSSTYSQPQHYMEVTGQLRSLADLDWEKGPWSTFNRKLIGS